MRRSYLAIAAAVLVLAGCNTYYQKTYQKIMVLTPGVDHAHCTLTTKTNKYVVMTPDKVLVERANLPLTTYCEKTGYDSDVVTVTPRVYANAAALNVFNGVLPGMAYDVASKSIYNYPDTISVPMTLAPQGAPEFEPPYTLQKKPEPVKAQPPATAPKDKAAAEKSMSKSLRK